MKNTIDIQNLNDTRKVTIDKVGVKGVKYPIIVEDRTNETQHTIADLDIFVELPHHHRGTHMSRFIEILNEYHQRNVISEIENFVLETKKRLDADSAFVNIAFPYFINKTAPVSAIKSLMSYDCFFIASHRDEFEMQIGVKVPITTVCPCSKEISEYGAHNQRSIVTVTIKYSEYVWLEELIEIVEAAASCEVYSLLKRSDEKYVTEKGYDNPKFVEDIVRDVVVELRKDKRITDYSVESENFESIHNHSAYASVTSGRNK
jgi:GTP cyclohydrolase I